MSSIRRVLFVLLAAGTPTLHAQDDPGWMLSLSALRDENAYEHAIASLHLRIAEPTWLAVTAGSSRAPSAETEVAARLLATDFEHDFGPAGIGIGLVSWGDSNNLETQDVRGELFFSGERYRLGLVAERRDIDVYFSGDGAPRLTDLRRVGLSADAIGISGRFRLTPDWQIHGSWLSYDYPPRLNVIPRAERLSLLSTSTVTLAYSFVERYATVGIEKAFGQTLLNIDIARDRSAIDQAELASLSAAVLLPVAARLDLELTLGSSRLEGSGSSLYGGVALLIYGGG